MARMHSRKKGKSGSTRPQRTSNPEWVEMTKADMEKLMVKLSKDGNSPSEIGTILRDQYGIPLARYVTGERIVDTLEKKGIKKDIPDDLMDLLKRAVQVNKHLDENKKDMVSKRGLQTIEAKIRRLAKYYRREKRIPEDWKYHIDTAKLLVK
jgi:small subunit ribosomal protein S15